MLQRIEHKKRPLYGPYCLNYHLFSFSSTLPLDCPSDVIQISSHSTFFYKRVFPSIWFGFLGFFICIAVVAAIAQQQLVIVLPLIGIPLLMAVFGYAIMRWIVFDLVDEVWDCGDSLVVRNNGFEQRFALSEFKNVGYTGFINPPRITLSLLTPSDFFGTEVAFIPPFRLFSHSMSPIARNLIERIDEARGKRPS